MAITNDHELRKAVQQAGALIQEIQDYCGRTTTEESRIRFPRGYIRTATQQRARLSFITDETLLANLSYTLILTDTIAWLLNRTDIAATAREMLIKLQVFLVGTLVESITKHYLAGRCGKSFKDRNAWLRVAGIIDDELKEELNWVWDTRNNMHLFLLEEREYVNDYNQGAQRRCAQAFKDLLRALEAQGPLA